MQGSDGRPPCSAFENFALAHGAIKYIGHYRRPSHRSARISPLADRQFQKPFNLRDLTLFSILYGYEWHFTIQLAIHRRSNLNYRQKTVGDRFFTNKYFPRRFLFQKAKEGGAVGLQTRQPAAYGGGAEPPGRHCTPPLGHLLPSCCRAPQ